MVIVNILFYLISFIIENLSITPWVMKNIKNNTNYTSGCTFKCFVAVKFIEIRDDVPVSAFGSVLPSLQTQYVTVLLLTVARFVSVNHAVSV